VFDTPELIEAARINAEKVALLRSAARVADSVDALVAAALAETAAPGRLSTERRRVAGEMFYEPGGATGRAIALIRELLTVGARRGQPVGESVHQPLGGGLS
jgi:hypothetical protein